MRRSSSTPRASRAYLSGSRYEKARSSSSACTSAIPRRLASGAYISMVSRALFCCCKGFITASVRILWRRSANFSTTTRGSSTIASSILRTVSERCRRFSSFACWRRCSSARARSASFSCAVCAPASAGTGTGVTPGTSASNLVTPSTILATASPNCSRISSSEKVVSSTTSCSRAAAIPLASMRISARSSATSRGCWINASPERRNVPICALFASS